MPSEFPYFEVCRGRTVLVRRVTRPGVKTVMWQCEVNRRAVGQSWGTRRRAIVFAKSMVRQINMLVADPLERDPVPGQEVTG